MYAPMEEQPPQNELALKVVSKYLAEGETTWEDVKRRMCLNLPESISEPIMNDRIIPAGSILRGFNDPNYNGSLSNCYYIPIEEDSIEGIFKTCERMARIYSKRGGVGIDLSILRPKGATVNNAARRSTGAVSFMPLFSTVTDTIGQEGRRGALMMSMNVMHPDILDFINAKAFPEKVFNVGDSFGGDTKKVEFANLSIQVTDKFMQAVENDEQWPLMFPDIDAVGTDVYTKEWDGDFDAWVAKGYPMKEYNTGSARYLLGEIAAASHKCGDPNLLFRDTAQRMAPASAIGPELVPQGCNPCGEQWMPAWGNCLLVAMALHKYVINPFRPNAEFRYRTFIMDVVAAVKFADIVSRSNSDRHPYPEQQEMDKRSRRIGIEPTGLADCLAMMGFQYGSEESIDFIRNLFAEKAFAELYASMAIARDGAGKALVFKEDQGGGIIRFMGSPYMLNLWKQDCESVEAYLISKEDLTQGILRWGLAHTAFNTAGPCGSISIMADNCTSGIEPLYAWEYERRTRLSNETYKVRHLPAVLYGGRREHYVEAHNLSWRDRIKVQAAVQEFTDSSISSTINLPESVTVDEIEQIYIEAWKAGLKGITIFRDNCKEGVLSVGTKDQKEPPKVVTDIPVMYKKTLLDLEDAKRHRVIWKGAKVYVIISLDSEDAPVEIFAKLPRKAGMNREGVFEQDRYNELCANWDCITRQASTMLRYNIPLEEVLHQLEVSSCSIVDAPGVIHRVLKQYLPDTDITDEEDDYGSTGGTEEVENETHSTFRNKKRYICGWCGDTYESNKGSKLCSSCESELPYSEQIRITGSTTCPECGGDHYYRENGCRICKDCGFSKC